MNGYKVEKCKECGNHYTITNPFKKNEKALPCDLIERMSKPVATRRAKSLPSAKLVGDIYNENLKYSY